MPRKSGSRKNIKQHIVVFGHKSVVVVSSSSPSSSSLLRRRRRHRRQHHHISCCTHSRRKRPNKEEPNPPTHPFHYTNTKKQKPTNHKSGGWQRQHFKPRSACVASRRHCYCAVRACECGTGGGRQDARTTGRRTPDRIVVSQSVSRSVCVCSTCMRACACVHVPVSSRFACVFRCAKQPPSSPPGRLPKTPRIIS